MIVRNRTSRQFRSSEIEHVDERSHMHWQIFRLFLRRKRNASFIVSFLIDSDTVAREALEDDRY